MKHIPGMTDEEVEAIISRVIRRIAPEFIFGYYDLDDIKQEAFMFAMDGLHRYDGVRPLAVFMRTHVRNRLKNFKRNKYFRMERPKAEHLVEGWQALNDAKRNLMSPVNIEDVAKENLFATNEVMDELEYGDLVRRIEQRLPLELRNDYLRLVAGVKLSDERREAVRGAVDEIIGCES